MWTLFIIALMAVTCSQAESPFSEEFATEDWENKLLSVPGEIEQFVLRPYKTNMKLYNSERPSTPNHLLSFIASFDPAAPDICGRFDNVVDIFQSIRKLKPIECALDEDYHGLADMETMKDIAQVLAPTTNHTKRSLPGKCVFVFFYSKHCAASIVMLPEFYVASTFFSNIQAVLIDSFKFYSLNTDFGVIGLPTLMLFHQGKPVGKYNGHVPSNAVKLIKFLWVNTNLEPVYDPNFVRHDFSALGGPFSLSEPDPYLTLAWSFIFICALYYFVQTEAFRRLVEWLKQSQASLVSLWNQHAHSD